MKGVFLAASAMFLYSGVLVFVLSVLKPRRKFSSILRVFAGACVLYAVLYVWTPKNLGFLPITVLEPRLTNDVLNGFLLLQLFFWLFIFQTYSVVSRGFSLGLLIVIHGAGARGMSVSEVERAFAGGRGVEANFEDKLQDAAQSGLIVSENGEYRNTPHGLRLAYFAEAAKKFFGTGAGG